MTVRLNFIKICITACKASALHILVKHKEQAGDIIATLKEGAQCDLLAKQHSTYPSGKKSGNLGEFTQGSNGTSI